MEVLERAVQWVPLLKTFNDNHNPPHRMLCMETVDQSNRVFLGQLRRKCDQWRSISRWYYINGEAYPMLTPTPNPTYTRLHENPLLNNKLWSTLQIRLSSRSQHCNKESSAISTPAARPMIVSDRWHTGINYPPAALSVSCRWVVDVKSRELKWTARLTTALRNSDMIDRSSGISGRMAIWEEVIGRQDLASVISLLISLCFSMA